MCGALTPSGLLHLVSIGRESGGTAFLTLTNASLPTHPSAVQQGFGERSPLLNGSNNSQSRSKGAYTNGHQTEDGLSASGQDGPEYK